MQPKPISLEDVDISPMEFWARSIEHREGAFARLRAEDPIRFFDEWLPPGLPPELEKGPGYWALTRHKHVLAASRNPQTFSSAHGATAIQDMPPEMLEFFGGMINMDDPRHGRQRRIVSRGFTPRALKNLEASVDRRAKAIVDRIIEKGECDFVRDIAAPLPLEIICDMLGIPESQTQMVFENTNIILGLSDPEFVKESTTGLVQAMTAGANLAGLMREMAADRKKNPREDLTSALLHAAEGDDDMFTEEELVAFFILLVVAGNETTRNAISHGMKALCDYPEQRAIWAADYEGIATTAVDEIVRWSSPVIFMRRTVTQDTVLDGTAMKKGDKVTLWYASANRDEEVFDDPFSFNVRRTPNEHVGFGGPGPHYCLGANLARREIRVMFRELFQRLPDLQITGPPERLQSNFINGIKRMPCAFTPGSSQG